MYIFLYVRYGYVYRCICLCIYTCMWDVCMCEKKERKIEGEKEMCVCACMCVHISYFLTQVYTEDKIKIILQQQAGSQRFIYIHCYHQGDEWGRSEALLQDPLWEWRRRRDATETCTNLKAEGFGRCYLGNPGGITQGRRRGKRLVSYVLGGCLKKKSEKGFQETAGTYVVCVAVDPERCSVGTGRWARARRWKQKGETKKKKK